MGRQIVTKRDIATEVVRQQSKFRILKKTWQLIDQLERVEYRIQQFVEFGFFRRRFYGIDGRWKTMPRKMGHYRIGELVFSTRSGYSSDFVYRNCTTDYENIVGDYIVDTTEPKELIIRED